MNWRLKNSLLPAIAARSGNSVIVMTYFGQGLRLYYTTIGMNGGYANMGQNWINQSYIKGGSSNYLSGNSRYKSE